MGQCCKTCRWLCVEPDKAGRRVVRKGYVYECDAPMPELPPIPESVRMPADWNRWKMEGSYGENCPTWAALNAVVAPQD